MATEKAPKKLTREEKRNQKARRKELHQAKLAAARESLAAKIQALGDDALLDEYETAAYYDKSVQSLRNYRINGGPIPFIKIGAAVRYRLRELKAA